MSHSKPALEIRGTVHFESKWNLRITAGVLSERLLSGIPFSDEIPGLRDEVPAVALTRDLLGLTFVLHGCCEGERWDFSLECSPGEMMFGLVSSTVTETADIGKWLAQLVGTIPEFRVVAHSPS